MVNSNSLVVSAVLKLCAGTGNKFSGTDGDSNILKIFRMLDRSGSNQLHYYQVGSSPFNGTSLCGTNGMGNIIESNDGDADSLL